MKIRITVLLMLGPISWAQLHAQSQQVSTTIRVQARVEAGCEVTASDLNLGTYAARGGAPLQVAALMRATCTPNTTYDVGLNKGTSRSVISGNTIGTNTVFGGVPRAQFVPIGDYADTITVRVYY